MRWDIRSEVMIRFCIGLYWFGFGLVTNPIVSRDVYPACLKGIFVGLVCIAVASVLRFGYELGRKSV